MDTCIICKEKLIYVEFPIYYRHGYYYNICSLKCLMEFLATRLSYSKTVLIDEEE